MTEELLNLKITKLANAFLKLKTIDECKSFLRDIATFKDTGASTATITRVAHWLHHGYGGYGLVLAPKKK